MRMRQDNFATFSKGSYIGSGSLHKEHVSGCAWRLDDTVIKPANWVQGAKIETDPYHWKETFDPKHKWNFFRVHNSSAVQLEFTGSDENDSFDRVQDCTVYGYSRLAIQLCIKSGDAPHKLIAGRIRSCPLV